MKKILLTIVLFSLFTSSHPALAFRLSPMIVEFHSSGQKATQTFLVENTTKQKIAIQFETFHREMDNDGKETRTESKDFLIYPEQLSLEPGEKRNVRLTWIGGEITEKEKAFRLIASQLPVDFKRPDQKQQIAGVNLNFLLQYIASLYITPPKAKAKITASSVKKVQLAKAATKIELVLTNSGTAHKVLRDIKVIFYSEGKNKSKWEVPFEQLKEIESENILPDHSRKFYFVPPANFPLNNLKAEVSLPTA